MNILFICSANKDRSKTAEDYFSSVFPEHSFDSAGTNQKICLQLGTNYMAEELLDWADKIFVMESKHKEAINAVFGNKYSKKISVLNIQDIYQYNNRELLEILNSKVFF